MKFILTLFAISVLFGDHTHAKPNILADDLGNGDVQCNSPERGKGATPASLEIEKRLASLKKSCGTCACL